MVEVQNAEEEKKGYSRRIHARSYANNTLPYKAILQYNTTVQYNTTIQYYNTTIQYYNTILQYNTAIQYCTHAQNIILLKLKITRFLQLN